ncbi:hypothetical protein FHW84_002740 [Dyella sp. SG562]|uniref:DUF4129 domain-containing protein n=1 Tax=Dyella TaxID=231454 RepID=UPI00141EA1F1|nr:DUF4129 domain-containing protein [Dyella sp. SG562]NII74155.1 hypothetical protein [Dyella sp. SG562]
MELERITVALRPRTAREAVDLGAAMLRAHARTVWSAWFAFSLPVAALCIALGWLLHWPWLATLLIWWLLPLFDRVPLYVLSRAVFERAPRWRETLRGQRQWRWGGTIASITWRRIDSHRALRLPMELLEGLAGKQRGERWRVLRRPIGTEASSLAFGCLELALVIFLGLFLSVVLFIPAELMPDWVRGSVGGVARRTPEVTGALIAGVAYLAWSAIEPLHVAAGFALYLNRRTQLEAWDVDLAFRRLRDRWLAAGRAAAVLLLALVCACPHGAWAQKVAAPKKEEAPVTRIEDAFAVPASNSDKRFATAAAEAFRDPRFGGAHKDHTWVPRNWSWNPKPVQLGRSPFEGFGNVLAIGVKGLLTLLLIGLIVAIAVYVIRRARMPVIAARARGEAKLDTHLETIEVQEVLPDDLAGATHRLWSGGHRREALALLYRGCVEQVAAALQLPVEQDATEADCLRSARRLGDTQRRQRAEAIVRAWQYAAYADRYPRDEDFARLLDGWPARHGSAA